MYFADLLRLPVRWDAVAYRDRESAGAPADVFVLL